MMNFEKIEKDLINEVKLSSIEAKVFLLITTKGKMSTEQIANELGITNNEAFKMAKNLTDLGGFIDISLTEFEAMHPRFTAVNMYRKMCTRQNIEFKKNLIVDNIGVILETYYERARTK